MKTRRIIVIDPIAKEVRELIVPNNLKSFRNVVEGNIELAVVLNLHQDEVYVNDEGCFKSPTHWFRIRGLAQPLAGMAYVIGCVTSAGDNRDVRSTVEQIEDLVLFIGEQ